MNLLFSADSIAGSPSAEAERQMSSALPMDSAVVLEGKYTAACLTPAANGPPLVWGSRLTLLTSGTSPH